MKLEEMSQAELEAMNYDDAVESFVAASKASC